MVMPDPITNQYPGKIQRAVITKLAGWLPGKLGEGSKDALDRPRAGSRDWVSERRDLKRKQAENTDRSTLGGKVRAGVRQASANQAARDLDGLDAIVYLREFRQLERQILEDRQRAHRRETQAAMVDPALAAELLHDVGQADHDRQTRAAALRNKVGHLEAAYRPYKGIRPKLLHPVEAARTTIALAEARRDFRWTFRHGHSAAREDKRLARDLQKGKIKPDDLATLDAREQVEGQQARDNMIRVGQLLGEMDTTIPRQYRNRKINTILERTGPTVDPDMHPDLAQYQAHLRGALVAYGGDVTIKALDARSIRAQEKIFAAARQLVPAFHAAAGVPYNPGADVWNQAPTPVPQRQITRSLGL